MFSKIRQIFLLTPVCTLTWLSFWGISIFLTLEFHWPLFMIPIFPLLLLIFHELVAFTLGYGWFSSRERIARSYEWGNLFMDGCEKAEFEKIGDLTEGYFNGDYTKSLQQATVDKYDRIIELLNLKKGDRVLDVGCGLGDFLNYLRSKGIDGVGVTVSPDQVRTCLNRGLNVSLLDFRKSLPSKWIGQFDAVTFLGCLEHFVESYALLHPQKINAVYQKTFESAQKCLNPHSSIRRVFSTTLHVNKKMPVSWKRKLGFYLLHGHYSGFYPEEGVLEMASKPYFDVLHTYDASLDYQYSSVKCKFHFGDFKINWNFERFVFCLALFLANPFAWATLLYHSLSIWMWQFGGREVIPENQRPTRTLWYVYTA